MLPITVLGMKHKHSSVIYYRFDGKADHISSPKQELKENREYGVCCTSLNWDDSNLSSIRSIE